MSGKAPTDAPHEVSSGSPVGSPTDSLAGTPTGSPVGSPTGSPIGSPTGIDELLERVRARLDRVEARTAYEAHQAGDVLLVDTRYAALRERDGLVPGALVVERNELEWRLDPLGSHRLPEADRHDLRIVVFCNEGYASSLAAESLRRLGLYRATDLIGGFQAWKAAGLPVLPPTAAEAGATNRAPSGGSGLREAEQQGAGPHGAEPHGAGPHDAEPDGAEPHSAEPDGAEPHGAGPARC